MIKYLQKLRAKKGFTLVELIVVIAIIGVLAAILIPTMLGYVTSSRVQSANTTASEIQKSVNNWLTDMDSKGVGMKKGEENVVVIYAKFAASCAGGALSDSRCEIDSALAGAYVAASWNVKTSVCAAGQNLQENFESNMGSLLPDASGTACIIMVGGNAEFVAWTPDSEGGTATDMAATETTGIIAAYSTVASHKATVATFLASGWLGWDSGTGTPGQGTNGIGTDGQTYGTAPVFSNPVV